LCSLTNVLSITCGDSNAPDATLQLRLTQWHFLAEIQRWCCSVVKKALMMQVTTDVSCLEAVFCVRGLEHTLKEKNTSDECDNARSFPVSYAR